MYSRSSNSSSYRYSFQGQEQDDEIKGEGNSYDFGARIYDPRIGRWLALDPKKEKFSSNSPYHFGFNNPIITIDRDGKENIVVIGNANDPEDPNPHPAGRQVLITGLNEAIRLRTERTEGSEETVLMVFDGTYTTAELNEFTKKADAAKIKYMIVYSVDEINNYVNEKTVDSPRSSDLITDFSYVGHSNSQELIVGYGTLNQDEDFDVITESNFTSSSFSPMSCANLLGCRTANEDGGRVNITQKFARYLIGGEASGAPFDIMFGYTDKGKLGGAGTYYFQNASFPKEATGSSLPNSYSGSGKPMKLHSNSVNQIDTGNSNTRDIIKE